MRLYVLPPLESSIEPGIKTCVRERGSKSSVAALNSALMLERVNPGNAKTDGIDRLIAAINGPDRLAA